MIPRSVLTAGVWFVFELQLKDLIEDQEDDPEIRWAGAEDVELLAQMGWPEPKLRALFERGARVAMLERDGALVGCLWIEPTAHNPYDWLRFNLSPEDLWVIYTWVDPGHRGQRLFGRLRRFIALNCICEGYTRLLSAIGKENTPSLRANAKTPNRILGRILYLRCLGITVLRARGRLDVGWWAVGRQLELDRLLDEAR